MYNSIQCWKVKKGGAVSFCQGWNRLMARLQENYGKFPYRLYRSCDGSWRTESWWPDSRTWQEAVQSLEELEPDGLRFIEKCVSQNVYETLGMEAAAAAK